MTDRTHFLTEQRLPQSMNLDALSIDDALKVFNDQDRVAIAAVEKERLHVAAAIELVATALGAGGRLLYFGAGTSGRLGVLDASECPPTFRTDPDQVQGIIAGGKEAMFRAQEGAEDSREGAARDVDALMVGGLDVVMGIASGGTTPYVQGAIQRARQLGAKTIFLSCVLPFDGEEKVDVVIRPLVGPEVLTGSTRLKAGTATKLILNQITTLSMVRLGKCYENLMVDLKASNVKLIDRAVRTVRMLTGTDNETAARLVKQAGGHVKLAVVMQKLNMDASTAMQKLDATKGDLRAALQSSPPVAFDGKGQD